MKNFFKKLTILFSVFVLTFISLVSFKTFNNTDEVKAIGYNTQTTNNNYTTLAYTGDLFFTNSVIVYTDNTTKTLLDFWTYDLSSGFISYLDSLTYGYTTNFTGSYVYVDGAPYSYSKVVSSFSVGTHSIYFKYLKYTNSNLEGSWENSPIGSFTVTVVAPDTYYLAWQKTNNLITLNYESSTSQSTLKNAFISAFKNNITSVYVINQDSDVIYTLTSSDINNLNYTDITGSTFYYGNETKSVSFGIGYNYNGHSLVNLTLENQPYKWYYTAPPVCSPYLTISISNGLELPYTSSTITESDLISELISHNDGFIGSYKNSSCVVSNIDVSTAVVDLVDYIQLAVGNNTIQFNVSYQGLSLTKTINVVLLPSSGGEQQDYFNLKDMILFIMSTPITLISGIFDFTIFGFNMKNLLFVLFSVAIIVFVISFLKGKRGD